MPSHFNAGSTALLIAGSLAISACASKAPQQLPPDPIPDRNVATTDPNTPAEGSQAHFLSVMRGDDTIYFDTDRFNVDSVDAAALTKQAQYLQRYSEKRITIEGHCDERGTVDYNLALGERRANAAKNYLVSLGISASRISTLTYGKERPIAMGSNESAWSQNRRAVTVTID